MPSHAVHLQELFAVMPIAAIMALASAIAGDAVADSIEFDELFNVDVDQIAGMIALLPPDRLGRFQCT